jgi:two-component system, NarL family, sensor histidine kinase DesK
VITHFDGGDRPKRDIGWTPYLWLVYLVFFIAPLLTGHPTTTQVVWSLVAVAVFLPLYFAAFRTGGRRLLLIAWTVHAIGAIILPINPAGVCFFIYGASFLAFTSRPAVVVGWLAVMLLSIAAQCLWHGLPSWTWLPVIAVAGVVGATNIHFAEMRRKDHRLRVAQASVEEMARIAERERIGRDLHDLLGHTLSVIVLKSEVASRLAERDPVRAMQEIREVERISREALGEVRKAVRGYRSEGLLDEIANAERVLVGAGITPEISMTPPALPPTLGADGERALAYALREAVTNVVRHAGATRCWIRLAEDRGRMQLEVRDNGRGGLAPEGSGLSGMRERLRQVAGTLERDGQQGTRLVMSLPAQGSSS